MMSKSINRGIITTMSSFSIFIFIYLTAVCFYFFVDVIRVDRYFRQRRIVDAAANYSKIVSFESIHENLEFVRFTEHLKDLRAAPYIIFYDSSNIDVLLNHICNMDFITESIERLAAVALDARAYDELKQKYPDIPNVLIDLTPTKKELKNVEENRKFVYYHLILLTRARVTASLALRGLSFWIMQQDSIWAGDLGALNLENRYPDAHLLFDTVGNDLLMVYRRMHGWICGSTFYVKGSPITYDFFRKLDIMMRSRFSPDSAIMTYLCGYDHYKCERLPRWIVSSSNYLRGPRETVPIITQMDTDQSKMPKMRFFKKSNLIFRHKNGTCNKNALMTIRESLKNVSPETIENNLYYQEDTMQRIRYDMRDIFNIDPNNNKLFLTVHEGLI